MNYVIQSVGCTLYGFNSVMQAITLAMRLKYNHYCG